MRKPWIVDELFDTKIIKDEGEQWVGEREREASGGDITDHDLLHVFVYLLFTLKYKTPSSINSSSSIV